MRNILFAMVGVAALAGCTTAERDVAVGAGIGALAGQAIGGNTESTLIGAGAGALGGYLVNQSRRSGYCVYRDRDRYGRVYEYEARCRR